MLVTDTDVWRELKLMPADKTNLDNRYVDHHGGRCLVGQILGFMGIVLPTPNMGESGERLISLVPWFKEDHVFFTDEALKLLDCLQRNADSGLTWGEVRTLASGEPVGASEARIQTWPSGFTVSFTSVPKPLEKVL